MARTPENGGDVQRTDLPETLAEALFPISDPAKRGELEDYRLRFEAVHGPTDLTRYYTSMWPRDRQNWLMDYDAKRWFDGLPLFAKAYLRGKMEMAAQEGNLDDMPDRFLRLYVTKQMNLDYEVRGR